MMNQTRKRKNHALPSVDDTLEAGDVCVRGVVPSGLSGEDFALQLVVLLVWVPEHSSSTAMEATQTASRTLMQCRGGVEEDD